MRQIENEKPLAPKHRDHALSNNWQGYRELHIEPDWLLIYKLIPKEKVVRLWLFYDFNTGSYVLVRRIYADSDKKKRSFNHVIIDDLILEDFATEIPEIFQEALKRIEDGKCLLWQSNKTFNEVECNKPHS